jgi:hypothetical protein
VLVVWYTAVPPLYDSACSVRVTAPRTGAASTVPPSYDVRVSEIASAGRFGVVPQATPTVFSVLGSVTSIAAVL